MNDIDKILDRLSSLEKRYDDLLINYTEIKNLLWVKSLAVDTSKYDFSDCISKETTDSVINCFNKAFPKIKEYADSQEKQVGKASKHDFSDFLSEETEDPLTKWYVKKYLETTSKTSSQEPSEDAMYYTPVKTAKDSHLLRRGYNHGYGDGYKDGYKDGYEAGRKSCNESTDGKTLALPHGKWIVHPHSMIMECSCCGHEETAKDVGTIDLDKHFCSFCGADMREADHD